MRKFKYIILAILLISLSISSFPHILNGISSAPSGDLKFLETYSYAEFTSKLDPGDPFFKMINTDEAVQTSSKLGFCPESEAEEVWSYIHSPAFQKMLPDDLIFAWGTCQDEPGKSLFVLKEPGMENESPEQSDIQKIEIKDGSILITFSEVGGQKFEVLTGKNMGRDIAIVFKGQVYAAPRVQEAIAHGKCMISGNFSSGELEALKSVLE